MAAIYDAFDYMNTDDYKKRLQKKSDNFVPLGSKISKTNIRTSPIVVPNAALAAVKIVKPMPMSTHVSVKRAERPTTTTTRKAIIQKMPIIVQQDYDYKLNRPVSPITTNTSTRKQDGDDWSSIYDDDFHGGKKRTRKARRKRSRSVRSKRTKKSYSRRYRGRKGR
jgi:hypothetical protein